MTNLLNLSLYVPANKKHCTCCMQFCCIQNTRYETNFYHLYKLRLRVYIAGKYLIARIYANQPRALQREAPLFHEGYRSHIRAATFGWSNILTCGQFVQPDGYNPVYRIPSAAKCIPEITTTEIRRAIRREKKRRKPSIDKIYVSIMKKL